MTREQAKELLPVIQAYAEGKTIQVDYARNPEGWKDYEGNEACFDNENWIWRVKPEPREFWLSMELPDTGTFAKVYRQPVTTSEYKTIIHVREVVD